MITDMIEQSPEYQQLEAQQGVTAGQKTVGQTLGPLASAEKGDIEFWLQVAQVVLLILILREVS